jgi:membrane-associated phospholipid phosphatase
MIPLAEILLVALATAGLLAAARRGSPLALFGRGAVRILTARRYLVPFLALMGMVAADVVETSFDDSLRGALGYDLTGAIHAIEGDLGSKAQLLASTPLTWGFTAVYIVLLPALACAPLALWASEEKLAAYRALAFALLLNYLIAIPFYFFFPVREMWSGNPGAVKLLMDRVSPALMEAYRANSALDNCFPSLHTSLAFTVPLIVRRVERGLLVAVAWCAAAAVAASTIYLGIHWISDVLAGCVLALVAARLALGKHGRAALAGHVPESGAAAGHGV